MSNQEIDSGTLKTLYELKLLDALKRLKNGQPNNPDLIRRSQNGDLRINISSVCLEANCSRTLVGFKGCKYPEIRELILNECQVLNPNRETSKETIRRLGNEISELKDKIAERDILYAELLLRTRAVERGLLTPLKNHLMSKSESLSSISIVGREKNKTR